MIYLDRNKAVHCSIVSSGLVTVKMKPKKNLNQVYAKKYESKGISWIQEFDLQIW